MLGDIVCERQRPRVPHAVIKTVFEHDEALAEVRFGLLDDIGRAHHSDSVATPEDSNEGLAEAAPMLYVKVAGLQTNLVDLDLCAHERCIGGRAERLEREWGGIHIIYSWEEELVY